MFVYSLLIAWTVGAAAPSGQVAYVTGTEQENQTVSVIDVQTGAIHAVGNGRRDGAPVWSPDGQWLAFESELEGGKRSIFLARANGDERRPLPHAHDWNTQPRWSADGARLAYTTGGEMGEWRIAVFDIQGGAEAAWGGSEVPLMRPVWGRDGRLMAVGLTVVPGALSTDLFTVGNSGASPLAPPTQARYFEWAIEPHPRKEIVAFESDDGGDREIFVASEDIGIKDVSNNAAADWNPVWSPDGEWIAFESFREGRRGVYRVFPDTQRVFPVAASKDYDNWAPTWSPDGEWIVFVSDRDGQPDLYVASADGTESRRLTEHAGPDLAPAWRPEARKK